MGASGIDLIELMAKRFGSLFEELVRFVQNQPLDAIEQEKGTYFFKLFNQWILKYYICLYLEKSSTGGLVVNKWHTRLGVVTKISNF